MERLGLQPESLKKLTSLEEAEGEVEQLTLKWEADTLKARDLRELHAFFVGNQDSSGRVPARV